jgi:hypothetical protein
MIGAREALAIACSTQFDAAAPSGGMVVVMGVWGMPAAVMVQVRVGASNYLLKGKATPANDHSFPFAFSPASRASRSALRRLRFSWNSGSA